LQVEKLRAALEANTGIGPGNNGSLSREIYLLWTNGRLPEELALQKAPWVARLLIAAEEKSAMTDKTQ
jgi:hypothetical protein